MSRSLLIACLSLAVLTTGCLRFHPDPLPGAPKGATYADVAGAHVRYIDTGGPGSPVVLVHGFASALDVWRPIIPTLSKHHRIIAMDLKGFGWTTRPAGDYSPKAEGDLVWALLDKLGVQRAAVVAHSWGSSVALQMALEHPRRVSRIALYDAWVYEEQLPTAFLWARAKGVGELIFGLFYRERPDDKIELAFYDKSYVTQPFVDAVRAALDRPGTTAAALAAVRGQRYTQVEKRYSKIEQPVLLLWGAEDAVATPDVAARLHEQLPHSKLMLFEHCGHFPMIEAFHPSTDALVGFLDNGDAAKKTVAAPVDTPTTAPAAPGAP